MFEVARYWIAASYFIAIAVAVDQLRRPMSAWETAGRERRFWVVLTLVLGFHGLGQYGALAYVTRVLPRFGGAVATGPRPPVQWLGGAIARGRGGRTATEVLALALIWVISRTVGVPVGPQPWQPEAIGGADVLSTLDELATVVLVLVVLAGLRGRMLISRAHVRLASMVSGPLFIYSVLLTFGGVHHHHY